MSESRSSNSPTNKKRRAQDGAAAEIVLSAEEHQNLIKLVEGAKAVILKSLWNDGKKFWGNLPIEWKNDREVAMAALRHYTVKHEDLPLQFQNDRGFWVDCVNGEDSNVWFDLPDNLQNDSEFARSVIEVFTEPELLKTLLEKFPDLRNDRDIWFAIVNSTVHWDIRQFIDDFAPAAIRRDYEIMLKACKKDATVLSDLVPTDLSENRKFLEQLLALHPMALQSMPPTSMLMFPDLVIQCLPTASLSFRGNRRKTMLAESIPAHLWINNNDISRTLVQIRWTLS